jgi:predicted nucleotidyltransferase
MGRYTASQLAGADQFISAQLETISDELKKQLPQVEGIVLVGSFGRGEGGVQLTPDGLRAVNDYDLIIVVNKPLERSALKELSSRLARELAVDFVDIGVLLRSELTKLEPTVFNFDLKHGSQVLFGDRDLLQKVPHFEEADLPPWEGLQLLFNRTAGLLSAVSGAQGSTTIQIGEPSYFANQVVKALVSCGDSVLIIKGLYHHLCRVRAERLDAILSTDNIASAADWDLVRKAYSEKLELGPLEMWSNGRFLFPVVDCLRVAFSEAISAHLGRPIPNTVTGLTGFLQSRRAGRMGKTLAWISPAAGVCPRDAAFALVSLALLSMPGVWTKERSARLHAIQLLFRMRPGFLVSGGWGSWERLRRESVDLWEKHCHG